jgi:hypothetical protein
MLSMVTAQLMWLSTQLQGVEEAECRRAYDAALDTYNSSFDCKRPLEEVGVADKQVAVNFSFEVFGNFTDLWIFAGFFERST